MRSIKLLAVLAAVAALVAGPVFAQEMAAPASTEMAAPAADAGKHHAKKHHGKKHHAKKAAADAMAPAK